MATATVLKTVWGNSRRSSTLLPSASVPKPRKHCGRCNGLLIHGAGFNSLAGYVEKLYCANCKRSIYIKVDSGWWFHHQTHDAICIGVPYEKWKHSKPGQWPADCRAIPYREIEEDPI